MPSARKLKLDLKPADLKAILDAVSWRAPAAKPVLKSGPLSPLSGQAKEPHPGLCGPPGSHYEPDSELRDTENVPLTWPGGIVAYFQKEVLPHVPDAWVDEEETVIGCEISFNKYFYQHQPLRPLEDVVAEIRQLETETEGLLEQILSFAR
jgi:type I restriction enzyme M protein